MKPSDCTGCAGYVDGEWCLAISYIHIEAKNIKSCACATCLVKPMCTTACDEFWSARNPKDKR